MHKIQIIIYGRELCSTVIANSRNAQFIPLPKIPLRFPGLQKHSLKIAQSYPGGISEIIKSGFKARAWRDKENANKRDNNLLQTTTLRVNSMYGAFFAARTLRGRKSFKNVKKKEGKKYSCSLSSNPFSLSACTMVSKKAGRSRYFAERACARCAVA